MTARLGELPAGRPAAAAPRLRKDAVSLTGAVVVGMASSGPTSAIALSLAALVGSAHYGGPVAVLICAVPMFGIALAYRQLNKWRATCGASYTWVGRAISPYLGFFVGWVMLLGFFVGAISDVLPIGPYVLSLFGRALPHSTLATALSGSAWLVIITAVAYADIQLTQRFQLARAAAEYLILGGCTVMCLIAVLAGRDGAVHFTWAWFSVRSMGGTGGLVSGVLLAVYMFSGWDSPMYLTEETERPETNPGRAVMISLVTLTIMFAFLVFAFQGAVPRQALLRNGPDALSYIAVQVAGPAWGRLMVAGVLLSVVGASQVALVAGARIAYAMAGDGSLPEVLAKLGRRGTPVVATLVLAGLALGALWAFVLGSASVQDAFTGLIGSVGLLFAVFYAATGVGVAVYYRRLAVRTARGFAQLLVIPAGSAAFLLWVAWRSVPGLGGWAGPVMKIMYVMLGAGAVMMVIARVRHPRSGYFGQPAEVYDPGARRRGRHARPRRRRASPAEPAQRGSGK